MEARFCRNGDRTKAVWGLKVGSTYHGGGRMVGGGLTHSPHYHLIHCAESDPLMGHTREVGGVGWGCFKQVSQHITVTPEEERPEENGRQGRQFGSMEAHRSTAHKTQTQWGKSGLGQICC